MWQLRYNPLEKLGYMIVKGGGDKEAYSSDP